jgi:hypothetical protein
MSTVGTATNACSGSGNFIYQRHRPEKTLLYQMVSKQHSAFRQQAAISLRQPSMTDQVLGIVYHFISLHAGVAARADERKKLERLCCYISRQAAHRAR